IVLTEERLVVGRQGDALVGYAQRYIIARLNEYRSVFVVDFDHLDVLPQTGTGQRIVLTPVDYAPLAEDLVAGAIDKVKARVIIGHTDKAAGIVEDGRLTRIAQVFRTIVKRHITRPDHTVVAVLVVTVLVSDVE